MWSGIYYSTSHYQRYSRPFVLEDIDNYNTLYATTEICTAEPTTCSRHGLFTTEGNSYNVKFGGWARHPTEGFQNGTMIRTGEPANMCFVDVTFTPLSGVFSGACKKYIHLSVMEGLEVWLHLDNIANVLKYEFKSRC